jgi:hypothetical protein
MVVAAAVALAGGSAFATWWSTTLYGLPDVGDPFDVAAFAKPIADETNAFVLYRKWTGLWKTASPEERAWLDLSREALATWRDGTERPDARDIDPAVRTYETRFDVSRSLMEFARLGLLEGSRLEEASDFAGAFDWYRAVLRSSRHLGRRGGFIERIDGVSVHILACRRLSSWAVEPKVDATLLRKALDSAIAADQATPPISDSLKAEYLTMLHSLADPELMLRLHDYEVVPNGQGGSVTLYGQHGWKSGWLRVCRRAIHEPERSRRVIRMIYANWLTYADLPSSSRPPRVLSGANVKPADSPLALLNDLYVVSDDLPAPAQALPPETLAHWFDSTMDAKILFPAFVAIEKTIGRERTVQAALVMTLANELHRREHGDYPDRVEELVGPYLKALPEGFQSSTEPKGKP